VSIKSPLVALGQGGNHDCQRIANLTGAAEYIASYNTKQEDPDFRVIDNLYASKMARLSQYKDQVGIQDHLRVAANAVCSAQHVGTVQAAYTLLKLPFVQSSRRVITINCERKSEMTKSIIFKKKELDSLDPEASAELKGLQSSLGRRNAYHIFVIQQRNLLDNYDRTCNVSLFVLLTSYSLRERKQQEQISEPRLLLLDYDGFVKDPTRFCIGNTVFTVNKKKLLSICRLFIQ
jgi:1-aminocyclopropane-1-carboxylate deaminase/D-cysteine desulfhydrase-like pyridoxal-dependent ACC family enzyme